MTTMPDQIDSTAQAMSIGFTVAAAVFAASLACAWFLLPRSRAEPMPIPADT